MGKYIKKCYDTLRVGSYYKILDGKNVYFGVLLNKNIVEKHYIYNLELLTEFGIIYRNRPDHLIRLELSGEINKAKSSLMEAKLEYL
jgi:hypothetical protein